MKKILFIINTLGHAGAEMAMIEMMKNIDHENYEIYLYVLMSQGELIERVPSYIKLLNKHYDNVSVLSSEGKKVLVKNVLKSSFKNFSIFKNLFYVISNAYDMIKNKHFQIDKLLWRVISDGAQKIDDSFDLAVSYIEGGAAYFVADHIHAEKKAAFIHIDYEKAGYNRKIDKGCYTKFDNIFTVSSDVKESFIRYYPECAEKTRIFHNMLDREEIIRKSNLNGGFNDSYDGIRLLTVGRLTYQKGYDKAVLSLKILRDRGINARWYILGEGPERNHIESIIKKYGLQNDFILLVADDNPYPYYKQCDIYVHATRFEGKSIAVQEAQILGCAVAASNCSGNREQIVNGVDGMLFEFGAESIADGLELMIKDKELRKKIGKSAAARNILYKDDINMIYEMII